MQSPPFPVGVVAYAVEDGYAFDLEGMCFS